MDKEAKKEYMKHWRAANAARLKEYTKQYRTGDKYRDWKRANDKRYYSEVTKATPAQLARRAKTAKQWAAANRGKRAETAVRYRARNPDKIATANYRRYWADHEQSLAYYRARADYYRQWREKNEEALRSYAQRYWVENKEALQKQARGNYQQNKLEYIKRANKRRVLLTGNYTQQDINLLHDMQNGHCTGCSKAFAGKYEIDHIMPLALDPAGDVLGNLQLLCRPCNRRKRAMHPDDWAKRIGKLFV